MRERGYKRTKLELIYTLASVGKKWCHLEPSLQLVAKGWCGDLATDKEETAVCKAEEGVTKESGGCITVLEKLIQKKKQGFYFSKCENANHFQILGPLPNFYNNS